MAEGAKSRSDVAAARQSFDQGLEAFRSGEFDAAVSDFEAALRIEPHPSVLFNLGRAYAAAGRSIEAVSMLELYLAQEDPHLSRQRRALVTDLIASQRRLLGTIRIMTMTPGIAVQVDGTAIGETPWSSAIPATIGKHTIKGTRLGFIPTEVTIELDTATEREVELNLQPEPQTVATPTARVEPKPAPASLIAPPPPATPSRAPNRIGVAVLSVGIAALGIGSYFAIRARDSWSERQQHCAGGVCDAQAVEAWHDAKRYAFAADVSLALGVVSAGAGIYLLLAKGSEQSTSSTRLSVGGMSKGAVITIGGSL